MLSNVKKKKKQKKLGFVSVFLFHVLQNISELFKRKIHKNVRILMMINMVFHLTVRIWIITAYNIFLIFFECSPSYVLIKH